jgi:hypothetical protein
MGFRAGGRPYAPLYSCAPSAILSSPPSLCLDKKEKRGEKGESKEEKGNRKKYRVAVGAALPPSVMAEQDWTSSTVTLSHMQKLMKHGFMSMVELEAYLVSEDPAFPMPVEGYVVFFAAFYK